MNNKEISSKILKYAIAIVFLCFATTTAHLVFISYRYIPSSMGISLVINCALHIVALSAAIMFSSVSASSIQELSEERDKKESLADEKSQALFAEKIISGDFSFLESYVSTDPANTKVAAFISGFVSDVANAGEKKPTAKYKGPYGEALENVHAICTNLNSANKYIKEASAAIDKSNSNSLSGDNPLEPALKQLLSNMNAVDSLFAALAKMNIDIDPNKIAENENLSKSAFAINEKYTHSFSVMKNDLMSIKYISNSTARELQGFSRSTQEQADIIIQVKNTAIGAENKLKNLQVIISDGSKSILRNRSITDKNAEFRDMLKYIERVNGTSADLTAIMKSLHQLNTQLDKLTSSNNTGKDTANRLSAYVSEITKDIRSAMDTLNKFNFKDSIEFTKKKLPALDSSRLNPIPPKSITSGATTSETPRERRIKSGTPPLTPKPALKLANSTYDFSSKDYGKYSKK